MDPQEFINAIKTFFSIAQNMERKQHDRYDKIMGILGEHKGKFMK
jgi:hypothetical protein